MPYDCINAFTDGTESPNISRSMPLGSRPPPGRSACATPCVTASYNTQQYTQRTDNITELPCTDRVEWIGIEALVPNCCSRRLGSADAHTHVNANTRTDAQTNLK